MRRVAISSSASRAADAEEYNVSMPRRLAPLEALFANLKELGLPPNLVPLFLFLAYFVIFMVGIYLSATVLRSARRWSAERRRRRKLEIALAVEAARRARGEEPAPAAASSPAEDEKSGLAGAAVKGAVSVQQEWADGMERVRRALKRAKLEKYVQAFEETGYDDWHEILAMEEQALEALVTRVRFSANHADRFRGVVARARERKRIDDDEEMIENDCSLM